MRQVSRLLAPGLLALLLAGCASMGESLCEILDCQPPEPEPEPSPINDSIEPAPAWVTALKRDVAASPTERTERYGTLRTSFSAERCDAASVRLAALHLLHPEPPAEDLQAIRTSLRQCLDAAVKREYHTLARLLLPSFSQHADAAEQHTRLQQQLDDEQARNAALEEQLEALRAIDQSIRERGR